jgi:hypothetical protein
MPADGSNHPRTVISRARSYFSRIAFPPPMGQAKPSPEMSPGSRYKPNLRQRFGRLPSLVRRRLVPNVKIAVRRCPAVRGWLVRLPNAGRAGGRKVLAGSQPGGRSPDTVWTPAIPFRGSLRKRCRRCHSESVTEPLDLGERCYEGLTGALIVLGLLVIPSDLILDGLVEDAGWLLRSLSRYGGPRVWVAMGRTYGITPGREPEFCEFVNRSLGLLDAEAISVSGLGGDSVEILGRVQA